MRDIYHRTRTRDNLMIRNDPQWLTVSLSSVCVPYPYRLLIVPEYDWLSIWREYSWHHPTPVYLPFTNLYSYSNKAMSECIPFCNNTVFASCDDISPIELVTGRKHTDFNISRKWASSQLLTGCFPYTHTSFWINEETSAIDKEWQQIDWQSFPTSLLFNSYCLDTFTTLPPTGILHLKSLLWAFRIVYLLRGFLFRYW